LRRVAADAPITEETSLRIKNGFAAYGYVERRAVPAGGPVLEVVKWLVRLEGRDVTAPLLFAVALQSGPTNVVLKGALLVGQVSELHGLHDAVDDHGRSKSRSQS